MLRVRRRRRPTLDLALALITEDEPRAQDIALQTTTWDIRTSDHLAEDLPFQARPINALLHLAEDGLSRARSTAATR